MLIYYLSVLATLFPTVIPMRLEKWSEREWGERGHSALRIVQPPTHFRAPHTHTQPSVVSAWLMPTQYSYLEGLGICTYKCACTYLHPPHFCWTSSAEHLFCLPQGLKEILSGDLEMQRHSHEVLKHLGWEQVVQKVCHKTNHREPMLQIVCSSQQLHFIARLQSKKKLLL